MKQKISFKTSYSKNKTDYGWDCLQTSRSNKVSRNNVKQSKLAQHVK